jgi:hypothetical protein
MGRFRLRAWYQQEIRDENNSDRKATIYWIPGQEEKRIYAESHGLQDVININPEPEKKPTDDNGPQPSTSEDKN